MEVLRQVETIARPIAEERGAFVVEARMRGEHKGRVLEIFIETDEGVSTDLCAEVSRELSQALDDANVIRGAYQLVVSSPGTDNPIKLFRQYKRNVGRTLSLRVASESSPVEGELVALEGETLVLRLGKAGEIRKVPYADVAEARVKTPW